MQIKDCPFCGAASSVTEENTTQTFEYKGQKLVCDNYKVRECTECGESFELPDDNLENERRILNFRRKVDGLLLPEEIKALRDSLHFTQKDFAALLGVGEKSFTRYERGSVTQGRSMDNLLRLIKDNPQGTIAVLKGVNKPAEAEEVTLDELHPANPSAVTVLGTNTKAAMSPLQRFCD